MARRLHLTRDWDRGKGSQSLTKLEEPRLEGNALEDRLKESGFKLVGISNFDLIMNELNLDRSSSTYIEMQNYEFRFVLAYDFDNSKGRKYLVYARKWQR